MNKQELSETIAENFNISRKTIGVDIGLNDVIEIVLDTYSTERLPELEKKLEQFEGSQFKTYGQIEELEEMKNL